jgi:L-iditol 2-dehydrogenase
LEDFKKSADGNRNVEFLLYRRSNWHMIVHLLKEKKIDPVQFISHCYKLEELKRGFEIMRDKSEDYIKIMAVME